MASATRGLALFENSIPEITSLSKGGDGELGDLGDLNKTSGM